MKTLLLNRKKIRDLLDMADVLKAVEQAFREWEDATAQMPPKAYISLNKGDFRAMPAAVKDAVGMKWVNVHPGNSLTWSANRHGYNNLQRPGNRLSAGYNGWD